MLKFQKVTLDSKDLINKYLKKANYRCCDYNFETMIMWENTYHKSYAIVDDFLIIRSESDHRDSFLMPIGEGDAWAAIDQIKEYCHKKQEPLFIQRVLPNAMEALGSRLDHFELVRARDKDDYIYLTAKLADLPGKKLHSKRTNLNKFQRLYDWQYEPITAENIEECKVMNRRWCKEHDCCSDEDLRVEVSACSRGLKLFFELGLQGGLIRADGKVAAFTVASPLFPGSDVLTVHFEKALAEYPGSYTIMNQQLAASVRDQFLYLDREEDTGAEGLRKAKLSYQPALLEPQYDLVLKELLE